MKRAATTRQKFIAGAGACLFALAMVAIPARTIVVSALLDFGEITEGITRLPCWIVDHSRCLTLDRFDPTCPQCM